MDCIAAGQVLLSNAHMLETVEGAEESFICAILQQNACQANTKLLLALEACGEVAGEIRKGAVVYGCWLLSVKKSSIDKSEFSKRGMKLHTASISEKQMCLPGFTQALGFQEAWDH